MLLLVFLAVVRKQEHESITNKEMHFIDFPRQVSWQSIVDDVQSAQVKGAALPFILRHYEPLSHVRKHVREPLIEHKHAVFYHGVPLGIHAFQSMAINELMYHFHCTIKHIRTSGTLKKEFSPKGMNKIQADSRMLPMLPLLAFV
jgi:hypothetical protein